MDDGDALVVATSGSTGDAEGRRADPRGDRGPRPRRSTSAWRSIRRATAGWPACRWPTWAGSAWCSGRWSTASASTWSAAPTRPPWRRHPAELGSTLTSLVPTALDRTDASAYRWIVLGGAADPVERPANVVRTYGLTESGGGVVYWPGGPLPGVEVRVVDGEVQLRGPDAAALLPGRHRPAPRRRVAAHRRPRRARRRRARGAGPARRDDRQRRRERVARPRSRRCWPATPRCGRPPSSAGPTRSGATGSSRSWCRPTRRTRPTLEALRAAVREELPGRGRARELELVDRLPRSALGKLLRESLA